MKKCRCCNALITEKPIYSLRNIPSIVQNFPKEDELDKDIGIDIDLFQCMNCGLVQILQKPVYYYRDVIRAVAVSEDMRMFRKRYFETFINTTNLFGKKIIEIGAGEGEYMQMMSKNDISVVGIEHLKQSCDRARIKGLTVYEGFLEDEGYRIPEAPYDGFYVMNFLEHIPDLKSFLKAIYNNLKEDGVGLVEVPNGDMIISKGMFSELMLDHLSYFTSDTLKNVLEINGFEVISCEVIWHDYIISAIVKKRSNIESDIFDKEMNESIKRMDSFIKKSENKKGKTAIWGAGHQALLLMSQYSDIDKIDYVIDSALFKQNKYTPVSHRLIISPDLIEQNNITSILVMAGSYSDEICRIVKGKYPFVSVEKM